MQVVKEIETEFLAVVQKNIRMLTFGDPINNAKMLWINYSRSDRLAELYREHFYKPMWDNIKAKLQPGEPDLNGEIYLGK